MTKIETTKANLRAALDRLHAALVESALAQDKCRDAYALQDARAHLVALQNKTAWDTALYDAREALVVAVEKYLEAL